MTTAKMDGNQVREMEQIVASLEEDNRFVKKRISMISELFIINVMYILLASKTENYWNLFVKSLHGKGLFFGHL
jgi:hypothetical protein